MTLTLNSLPLHDLSYSICEFLTCHHTMLFAKSHKAALWSLRNEEGKFRIPNVTGLVESNDLIYRLSDCFGNVNEHPRDFYQTHTVFTPTRLSERVDSTLVKTAYFGCNLGYFGGQFVNVRQMYLYAISTNCLEQILNNCKSLLELTVHALSDTDLCDYQHTEIDPQSRFYDVDFKLQTRPSLKVFNILHCDVPCIHQILNLCPFLTNINIGHMASDLYFSQHTLSKNVNVKSWLVNDGHNSAIQLKNVLPNVRKILVKSTDDLLQFGNKFVDQIETLVLDFSDQAIRESSLNNIIYDFSFQSLKELHLIDVPFSDKLYKLLKFIAFLCEKNDRKISLRIDAIDNAKNELLPFFVEIANFVHHLEMTIGTGDRQYRFHNDTIDIPHILPQVVSLRKLFPHLAFFHWKLSVSEVEIYISKTRFETNCPCNTSSFEFEQDFSKELSKIGYSTRHFDNIREIRDQQPHICKYSEVKYYENYMAPYNCKTFDKPLDLFRYQFYKTLHYSLVGYERKSHRNSIRGEDFNPKFRVEAISKLEELYRNDAQSGQIWGDILQVYNQTVSKDTGIVECCTSYENKRKRF